MRDPRWNQRWRDRGNEMTLQIRLLGPLAVPRSRKVRALLGFLALAPCPVSRSRLCDLLWDVPNDPRGELRWCLSKLRALLDDGGRRRRAALPQERPAHRLRPVAVPRCVGRASDVAFGLGPVLLDAI